MLGLTLLAAVVAIPGLLFRQVTAQTTHASCTNNEYNWAYNSLDEDPCAVGEALGGVCPTDGSPFTIQALPEGYYYSGMNPSFATDCICNTVYFSLLAICAACQGGYASVWGDWSTNCTTKYNTYPEPIPAGITVPHWAYLALNANGTLDVAAAEADTGPDATPTASASSSKITTTHGTSTATSTSGSNTSSGSKKTNVGAIAGGVVGGVVFLALVAGLIWFCMRRSKKNKAPSAAYASTAPAGGNTYMSPAGAIPTSPSPFSEKPYDPSDPSTFPTTPGATYPQTPYSPAPYSPSPYSPPPESQSMLQPSYNGNPSYAGTPGNSAPYDNRMSTGPPPPVNPYANGPQAGYRGTPEV